MPRKTPRQARAQATHDAIVEAAAQLLAGRGLVGFNTNAVAERAGVSIGSLYQYFANKDALMAALIRRQQTRQAETLSIAVAQGPAATLEGTVRQLVRAAMQHHRDDALLATAIDHEEARLPMQAELDANLYDGGRMLGGLLAAHAGETRAVDPETAARTLPALVRAAVDAWANLTPPRLDLAEDEAVRAVLGYLKVGPA
jgi:AcrR family transcriptional regulator